MEPRGTRRAGTGTETEAHPHDTHATIPDRLPIEQLRHCFQLRFRAALSAVAAEWAGGARGERGPQTPLRCPSTRQALARGRGERRGANTTTCFAPSSTRPPRPAGPLATPSFSTPTRRS